MLFFRVGALQGLPAAERTPGSALYSSDDDEDNTNTWQGSAKEREALFDSIFSGAGPNLLGTATNVTVESSENVTNRASDSDTLPGQSQRFDDDEQPKKITKRKSRE